MIKSHKFNGNKYDIHIGRIDGMADSPRATGPNLIINSEVENTRKFLETAIHESLHCCSFAKSEELVTQSAHDIARFLWRLGWRIG